MKERQRWQAEEDTVLRDYVKQYGPRDWHLVSQRMGTLLDRDAKSCVERWKNYLKPGIKKGPLSDEEQQLVIRYLIPHNSFISCYRIESNHSGVTCKKLQQSYSILNSSLVTEEPPNELQKFEHDRPYKLSAYIFFLLLLCFRMSCSPRQFLANLAMNTHH